MKVLFKNKMIFITGDVHEDIGNWEQKEYGSNVLVAPPYLKILKKYSLSCTLFINGICLDREKDDVKKLLDYDVELGGHTYNNFGNLGMIKSYLYRKIWGCVYGPAFYQKRDIEKTKKAFENFGLKMTSWRTHAYASNDNTFSLLSKAGVTHVSDLLGEQKPFEKGGIIHLPINIPPEQNTFAYGHLTPENRDPFVGCTKGRITPDEWFEILKKRVVKNEKRGIPSIILIHPATMAYLDNFKLFEEVAKFLSKYKSGKLSEFKL
jgi:peptidoglycan/xylan/chitin deacetylase (PgdA/CDA1 family)